MPREYSSEFRRFSSSLCLDSCWQIRTQSFEELRRADTELTQIHSGRTKAASARNSRGRCGGPPCPEPGRWIDKSYPARDGVFRPSLISPRRLPMVVRQDSDGAPRLSGSAVRRLSDTRAVRLSVCVRESAVSAVRLSGTVRRCPGFAVRLSDQGSKRCYAFLSYFVTKNPRKAKGRCSGWAAWGSDRSQEQVGLESEVCCRSRT